jgi:hypothetical protein
MCSTIKGRLTTAKAERSNLNPKKRTCINSRIETSEK